MLIKKFCVIALFCLFICGVAEAESYKSLYELNGRRIGVQTGNPAWDSEVRKALPQSEIVYYNSFADLAAAIDTNKIDGFPIDSPVFELMSAYNHKIMILPEPLEENYDIAFAFRKSEKSQKLCDEMNEFIAAITKSGELQKLREKWTGADEDAKTVPDYASFPAKRGTLSMATEGEYAPLNYYRGNELVGLEIDLAALFCASYDYGLKISSMAFDGILPAIQSGKYDFAGASLCPTDEHGENVFFSLPYYTCTTYMVVLKNSEASSENTERKFAAFINDIKLSFERTFIREERWQLLFYGIYATMIITVLSIIFGTILGFVVYMLCRNGNIIANSVTRFSIWLIQGMPMVVLLMILYYVVFGSVSINGMWVAVIAFTLTFGCSMYGMILSGVGAIDKGQTEAAYALGFTDINAFFTIILPQAALHFMPAYKAEVVSHIKATAIVGYIAVQDLTKMGDIIRSRTYEAFFPLIAVAVIYFILAGILNIFTGAVHNRLKPEKRKRSEILKGIEIHDQA